MVKNNILILFIELSIDDDLFLSILERSSKNNRPRTGSGIIVVHLLGSDITYRPHLLKAVRFIAKNPIMCTYAINELF